MHQKFLMTLASLVISVAVVIAQEECSEFVQTALATVEEACAGTGRNQACFGNVALTAVGQPDAVNFQFSGVGDISDVAAIQSMQLSGYDPVNGVWGLVMMQIQANIPDTIPGQNVTVLLFGDVALENAAGSVIEQIPPEQERVIQATSNVNVRSLPSTNSTVIGSIAPNTGIIATGRTEDSQWIRVRFGAETGWIFAQLLASDFDASELLVVNNPEVPLYAPMQAFYITTGIGRPACNEIPDDGMVVQTPPGVPSITVYVNDATVEMGSTVYFNINEDGDMEVMPLQGSARVESDDEINTVIEGGYIEVPLDEEGHADGPPSEAQSYLGDEDIEDVPVEALNEEIEVDMGMTEEEFQDFQELEPILEYVDVEDADDFFNYAEESEDPNYVEYLIEEGYTDFGSELEDYFEEELDYDLSDYDGYTGDDVYIDNSYTDADGDGIIDSQDEFVDSDGDGIEDSVDDTVDADGDGVDDSVDDWVDTDGNGYDDRYGNGEGSGIDNDGDGVDDSVDDWVDTDGNGYDDRYGNGGQGGVDNDGDGVDDSVDDWVDTDGNGYDDRYGNGDGGGGSGGGTDADGDGIDDSVDDWVDADGNGYDDRYGNGDGGGGSGGSGSGSGSGSGGEDPCANITDVDNDCVDDSVDGWIDTNENGIDDRDE